MARHNIPLLLFREDGPAGKCLLRKPEAAGRAILPFNQYNTTARRPPPFSSPPFTGVIPPLKDMGPLFMAARWSLPLSSRTKRDYSEIKSKRIMGKRLSLLFKQSSRKRTKIS